MKYWILKAGVRAGSPLSKEEVLQYINVLTPDTPCCAVGDENVGWKTVADYFPELSGTSGAPPSGPMQKWLAFYQEAPEINAIVTSRNPLDAAKDFALISIRIGDCTIVVRPADKPDPKSVFLRKAGVWAPLQQQLPSLPSTHAIGNSAREDTYSYRGWLVSDSLLKRSFAVYGHLLFAGLILYVAVMIILIGGCAVGLGGCSALMSGLGRH
jgi:hypothetical protein